MIDSIQFFVRACTPWASLTCSASSTDANHELFVVPRASVRSCLFWQRIGRAVFSRSIKNEVDGFIHKCAQAEISTFPTVFLKTLTLLTEHKKA